MQSLSPDTSEAAAALQFEAWRRMSPTEKLAAVATLTASVRWLEREGWRRRHPHLSDVEIQFAIARVHLGDGLAERVYAVGVREP
ncbi:MAG: hypothetical protein C0503_04105 [Gemmatimonas sp.]|nr:hypothetical protein [Gemmatimonas sp.]